MKECTIVQDLLPLCADELTSPDTTAFIDRHLESCDECRSIWQRCVEPLPQTEMVDQAQIRKAMQKDAFRMTTYGIRRFILISLVPVLMMVGIIVFLYWDSGEMAPVELATECYSEVFQGQIEIEVADWDRSGYFSAGQGSIIRTGINYAFGTTSRRTLEVCWENVRVEWAPDGTNQLFTVELPSGQTDYFIIAYQCQLEESGGSARTVLYPMQPQRSSEKYGTGLTASLTRACREDAGMVQDWEEITFTFRRWREDSGAVEFFYVTDTGQLGTVWYVLSQEESTRLASMSYATTQILG